MEVLVWFKYQLLNFREAELLAVAGMLGVSESELDLRMPPGVAWPGTFRYATVPSEAVARQITERCALVSGMFEVWGGGLETVEALEADVRRRIGMGKGGPMGRYVGPGVEPYTFRFNVFGFGIAYTHTEKVAEMTETARYLDLSCGVVQLKDPDVTLWVHVSYGEEVMYRTAIQDRAEAAEEEEAGAETETETGGSGGGKGRRKRERKGELKNPQTAAEKEERARLVGSWRAKFVGREIALGQESNKAVGQLTLKNRAYLGPTSMTSQLSLLTCNMARVRGGTLVMDPFCGTGSILIWAAKLGAHVLGGDIDLLTLRGKALGEKGNKNVFDNFAQYGLPPPEIVRADNHMRPWTGARGGVSGDEGDPGWLDSIVADPPYGIRAGGRKSQAGGKRGVVGDIPEHRKKDHIPSTVGYPLVECIDDLMDTAAQMLRVGGRMAYWMPAVQGVTDSMPEHLASHPCLAHVSACEQMLACNISRFLVTVEKVKAWNPDTQATWDAHRASERPKPVYSCFDDGTALTLGERHRQKMAKAGTRNYLGRSKHV